MAHQTAAANNGKAALDAGSGTHIERNHAIPGIGPFADHATRDARKIVFIGQVEQTLQSLSLATVFLKLSELGFELRILVAKLRV